jgi:ABC-type transport system involved in cytochrome c biogenesis permease subunit
MPSSVLLAIASAGCFLALAHAAVNTPREPFRRMTSLMAALAVALVVLAPAAGVALLAPVLFSRRLANAPVPATVEELLERYPA